LYPRRIEFEASKHDGSITLILLLAARAVTMVSDGETASPSRRSSRKKARVSYDENVVKIHKEEKQKEKPNRRRAPPKKRHIAVNDYESSESEEEPVIVVRKPPPKKRKAASKSKGRGPESERTCPHCDQVCSSKSGLKYHVGKKCILCGVCAVATLLFLTPSAYHNSLYVT